VDSNGDFVYGMQESYGYYQTCKSTSRNKGLFTSDQNLQTNDARSTRQNPGATQYGFECSEERDYYPWWNPSPWKDIVVFTDDTKAMCPYYQAQSQNVASRYSCNNSNTNPNPFGQQACSAAGGQWLQTPSWGMPKPDCLQTPYNRDNHLGNGPGVYTNSYNWTLPTDKTEKCIIGNKCICVLRIRYNITAGEIAGYGVSGQKFTDSSSNANPPIWTDPTVQVSGINLTLAVNTNQYGRTFQDRSFTFYLAERPSNIPASAKLYNIGVRGKRGNIVQTYPATEYDFTPNDLHVTVNDYIHFQWTGCDTNPQNYEGEGTDGTDRSNIAQVPSLDDNQPLTDSQVSSGSFKLLFTDAGTRNSMAHLGQTNCLSYAQLLANNNNNQDDVDQDVQNCAKLNAAPTPYFNGGVVKMSQTGTFYYMSTRNNNFSNRTQRATILVNPLLPPWAVALIVIGAFSVATAGTITGGYIWARKHPHGRVAGIYDKVGEKFRALKHRIRGGAN